jgi:hypothetical protein
MILSTTTAFVSDRYRFNHRTIQLQSHTLTTALESLSIERRIVEPTYANIRWIDLLVDNLASSSSSSQSNDQQVKTTMNGDSDDKILPSTIEILPLYPLPAVYLPVDAMNHTLNNVEPQNIQMAKDLTMTMTTTTVTTLKQQISGDKVTTPPLADDDVTTKEYTATTAAIVDGYSWMGGRRFCTVLRAIDTGRIASVGVVLRIVDAEEQTHYGTTDIARIKLTCQPEDIVEIVQIVNPEAFSRERRLRRSDEYLRAIVRPFVTHSNDTNSNRTPVMEGNDRLSCTEEDTRTTSLLMLLLRVLGNFRLVKTMYQLELGADDFPPRMLSQLGDAIHDEKLTLELDGVDNDDCTAQLDSVVWKLAQEWQSICMTLRQGQQAILSTDRNERMIDAAISKGGPLKLPIHLGDLEPEARRGIQLLEGEAQSKHVQMGMDAILDFQVLVSIPSIEGRIRWLDLLIARERTRLENIASNR